MNATYLRFEILRTFRNRRFLIFSLAFPLVLFFSIAGAHRNATLGGISFPLYYMTGMAAWGTMVATISSGARIAAERQIGWTRQMRITPLPVKTYFSVKIIGGYLMALFTMAALYLAGSSLGVRLSAGGWLRMTALLLIGLIPFAVIGILFGHLMKVDSLGPALGGVTTLFALLGGAWGPLATGGVFLTIVKCIPSYWLVQAGESALGSGGWPPAEAWIVIAAWTIVMARLAMVVYQRDTARV
jgi:ABC-2 type transport system permease protein